MKITYTKLVDWKPTEKKMLNKLAYQMLKKLDRPRWKRLIAKRVAISLGIVALVAVAIIGVYITL